jgi:hypothetical protein
MFFIDYLEIIDTIVLKLLLISLCDLYIVHLL